MERLIKSILMFCFLFSISCSEESKNAHVRQGLSTNAQMQDLAQKNAEEIEKIWAEIDKLKERITNNETNIALNREDIEKLFDLYESLEIRVTEAENHLEWLCNRIVDIEKNIMNIDKKLIGIEKHLSNLDKSILALNIFRKVMEGKVAKLEFEDKVINGKLDVLFLYYKDMQDQIMKNRDDINKVTLKVGQIDIKLKNLYITVDKKFIQLDLTITKMQEEIKLKADKADLDAFYQEFIHAYAYINGTIATLAQQLARLERSSATKDELAAVKKELEENIVKMIEEKTKIYDKWVKNLQIIFDKFGGLNGVIARLEMVKQNQNRISDLENNFQTYKDYVSNTYVTQAEFDASMSLVNTKLDSIGENCVGYMGAILQEADVPKSHQQTVINVYNDLITARGTVGDLSALKNKIENRIVINSNIDIKANTPEVSDLKVSISALTGYLSNPNSPLYAANITEKFVNFRLAVEGMADELTNSLGVGMAVQTPDSQREKLYQSFRDFVKQDLGKDSCAFVDREDDVKENYNIPLEEELEVFQAVPGFGQGFETVHEYYTYEWLKKFFSDPRSNGEIKTWLMNTSPVVAFGSSESILLEMLSEGIFKLSRGKTPNCQKVIQKWQDDTFVDDSLISQINDHYPTPEQSDRKAAIALASQEIKTILSALKQAIETAFNVSMIDNGVKFLQLYISVSQALIDHAFFQEQADLLAADLDLQFDKVIAKLLNFNFLVPGLSSSERNAEQHISKFKDICINEFNPLSLQSQIAQNNSALRDLLQAVWGTSFFLGECKNTIQAKILAAANALGENLPSICGPGHTSCGDPDTSCLDTATTPSIVSLLHGFHSDMSQSTRLCDRSSGRTLTLINEAPGISLNNQCVAIARWKSSTFMNNFTANFFMQVITNNAHGFYIQGDNDDQIMNYQVPSNKYKNKDFDYTLSGFQADNNEISETTARVRLTDIIIDEYRTLNNCRTYLCLDLKPYQNVCVPNSDSEKHYGNLINYCFTVLSPIVLDFGQEGQKTVGPMEGVTFDMDADGEKEKSGWIRPGSKKLAFLALDLNDNGQIDDGAELFGNGTKLLESGEKAGNGYVALAQYDKNNDGVIDSKDKIFKKLKLWFDFDGDGKVSGKELKDLSSRGVLSLSVKFEESKIGMDMNTGNEIVFESTFKTTEKEYKSYDIFFATGSVKK